MLVSSNAISETVHSLDDCYKIGTSDELWKFALFANSRVKLNDKTPICGVLTADLNVNENLNAGNVVPWIPIEKFNGVFDGQGHVIRGLVFKDEKKDNVGFIGSVEKNAQVIIQNLGIENSYFEAKKNIGGIVGLVDSSANLTLKNVYYSGTLAGKINVGGLVGSAYRVSHLSIDNSFSTVKGVQLIGTVVRYPFKRNTYYNNEGLINELVFPLPIYVSNSFFCEGKESEIGGISVTSEDFENGFVVQAMLEYNAYELSIWGQNVGIDKHPVFKSGIHGSFERLKTSNVFLNDFSKKIVLRRSHKYDFPLPKLHHNGGVFIGWFDKNGNKIEIIKSNEVGDKVLFSKWIRFQEPLLVDGCYQIRNVDELYGFSAIVNGLAGMKKKRNACGVLTADLEINQHIKKSDLMIQNDFYMIDDVNASKMIPWIPMMDFGGSFDGQGHFISGIFIHAYSRGTGFFGSVRNEKRTVIIKNLIIKDSFIHGHNRIGAFVGFIDDFTSLSIEKSCNLSGVYGTPYLGGFVGFIGKSSSLFINDSYSGGEINGEEDYDAFIGGKEGNTKVSVKKSFYADSLFSKYGEKKPQKASMPNCINQN
ncbi:MAG: hypothetical protein IKA48_06030 [Fibrobacter sp.]|nr:hypothetical protein [Fibrobacter sp.]